MIAYKMVDISMVLGQSASAVMNKFCLFVFSSSVGLLKSSPPRQNGHHFADDIFKYIFMNEKFCILIRISLKFVPTEGPISNKSANRRQAIFWTNADPVHWHIYAALGGWVKVLKAYTVCWELTSIIQD